MPTVEDFNFISFSSRQHALYFAQLLKMPDIALK